MTASESKSKEGLQVGFRLAVLAVAVLSVAFAWTAAASALDTVPMTSASASADVSPPRSTIPDSVGGESATGTPTVTLDMDDADHWIMGSDWWILMPIMMALFWVGVIAVAVWGIRQFSRDGRRDGIALDIAKERLARGEITSEEFARIRGHVA